MSQHETDLRNVTAWEWLAHQQRPGLCIESLQLLRRCVSVLSLRQAAGGQKTVSEGQKTTAEDQAPLPQQQSEVSVEASDIKQETSTAAAQDLLTDPDQTASMAIFGSEIAEDKKPSQAPVVGAEPGGLSHVRAESHSPSETKAANQVPQIANVTEGTDTDMDGANQLQLSVYPDEPQPSSRESPSRRSPPRGAVQSFIVLCRDNGWLQLYALPDMQLVFAYQHASDGPTVMGQGLCSPDPRGLVGGAALQIVEVCIQSFGPTTTSGDSCTPSRNYRTSHHENPSSGLFA